MLIGITGAKGSGKDTFAEALPGFVNVKMAEALKEMLRALYRSAGMHRDLVERKLEGDLKETPCTVLAGKTPRYAMQTLGTEWRDMIHPRLWTWIWENRVRGLLDAGAPVVCTDIRFHHEVETLRELGGHLFRVERPKTGEGEDSHPSETEMNEIQVDETIYNIGTVRDLHDKARATIKGLMK